MRFQFITVVRGLSALLILLQAGFAFAGTVPASLSPIFNFRQDSRTLFRGGRPGHEGVAWLKAHGFVTIIDLEDDATDVSDEKTAAAAVGLRFLSFPMSTLKTPIDAEVNAIQFAINDPANQPVYVHCHNGQNRTGVIMALHRVESDNWPRQQAYNEMIADGFTVGGDWALLPYFVRRTANRR